MNAILTIATILPRAEEAWEPVLLGGLIPILGALAIVYLIVRAVRDNPENDDPKGDHDPTSDEEK